MMLRFTLCGLVAVISCVAQEGSQVYISHCMQCHSPTSATHAPTPDELAQTPWQEILKTLETGAMQVQAQSLSREERIAVPARTDVEVTSAPIEAIATSAA